MKTDSLRSAYRKLAREYHPDVNPDPRSHERMAKINTAFEVLIDPVRRMEYDVTLGMSHFEDPVHDPHASHAPRLVKTDIAFRLRDHRTPIYSLTFASDSGELVSSSFDNELIWWDIREGLAKRRMRLENGTVSNIEAITQGKLVAAGSSETSVSVWCLEADKVQSSRTTTIEWPTCVSVSPDGANVAMGSMHHRVLVCKASSGERVFLDDRLGESVTALAWSYDNELLAAGSADATVKLYSSPTGKEFHTFHTVRSTVTAMTFSPDRSMLAVAAVDLSIRIFDLNKLSLSKVLFGHDRPVENLAFHPSGWLLGSVSRDGCVGLWNAVNGIGHGKIEASHQALSAVAFSPDGRSMAAGGLDKVLRVWRLTLPN